MMMTRAEKLFCVEVQMQKAVSLIDHGDNPGAIMAIVDAIRTMAAIQKESAPPISPVPEKSEIHLEGERVKAPDPETRAALDTLRNEPTKIKRR